jgi:DNA polymerase III subunit delta'
MLGRAASEGTLAQSILLHGPTGAGKERLALWLGQAMLCESGNAEPCGQCRSCRQAERLEHPDLHWFFPLPRPDASSPEKLREKLEDARAEELRQWRETPLRVPQHEKAPAHYLAAVRTIQQLASVRPNSGSRSVFVVGDAELMVPQEASQEAANAFLKLLEEPPGHVTLMLTSSQPGALLPTILSRVLSVRVPPLREDTIESILREGGLGSDERVDSIARRARGSLRRALALAGAAGDGAPDPGRAAGRELLIAALTSGAAARLSAANDRKPAGARTELVGELDSLAEWLRDLAAVVAGAPDQVSDSEAVALLRRAGDRRSIRPASVVASIAHVTAARELAFRNVNPQLIVADLLAKLQRELIGDLAASGPTPERRGR